MKQIKIKHRESGEYVNATIDDEGVIKLENGRQANCGIWSYDDPVEWVNGLITIALCILAVYAIASSIVYFTASDERKFMRDCWQTASVEECKAQWFVMQRDKI